jgi:hypothetical protein
MIVISVNDNYVVVMIRFDVYPAISLVIEVNDPSLK